MKELDIFNFLDGTAFTIVYKPILRKLKNSDAALLLGELISLYKYHQKNKSLVFPNAFPVPYKQIEYNLGLSPHKIRTCLNVLEDAGLITQDQKGQGAIKHVELYRDRIAELLMEDRVEVEEKNVSQEEFIQSLKEGDDSKIYHEELKAPFKLLNDFCDYYNIQKDWSWKTWKLFSKLYRGKRDPVSLITNHLGLMGGVTRDLSTALDIIRKGVY